MFEPNALFVAALICLPAVLMASRGSTWLVDYLFFVVALNRGIRRVVDYNNGFFNSYSLISLTPIIVGGLATLVVIIQLNNRSNRIGKEALRVIYPYGIAVSIAFIVGFLNTKQGALYALGDYIAPIGLLGYGAIFADREDILNRWCHSVALSAVIVAGYGIWQFYTIPPWDAFWVREVNFEGYLGILEPTKMTLFSTMAERGPAALYLCSALILLILRPGTLWMLRWPAVVLILVAMLLTYSRTTVIQLSLACALYPILNRGSGLGLVVGVCALAMMFGENLLSSLPGASMAAQRVGTISSIQDDSSFAGRIQMFAIAGRASLSEPLGLGIGSHGMAGRISQAIAVGHMDSTGYVETLRTFGWIGSVLIILLLYRCWRSSSALVDAALDDQNVLLFRAWFASGLVVMFSGSWMFTATFFWVLAGHCLGRVDQVFGELDGETETDEEAFEEEFDEEFKYDDDGSSEPVVSLRMSI